MCLNGDYSNYCSVCCDYWCCYFYKFASWQRRYENGEITKEEEKAYKIKLKDKEEAEKRIQELLEQEKLKKTIVKTMIVAGDSRKSVGSVATRGLAGGLLFGPAGAIVACSTGKNVNSTTFLIEYADGHRETRNVENNSSEYNKYIKFLEM